MQKRWILLITVLAGSVAVPAGSSSLNGALQQSTIHAGASASSSHILDIAQSLSSK